MVNMAFFRLSILLCMMLFGPSLSGATLSKNVFILAGQSNMAGRGGVERDPTTNDLVWDGYVPPESQPHPSILRFNPEFKWEQARECIHRDIDLNKTVGVGPAMPFAHQLLDKAGSKVGIVGLVPTARGGTLIRQWLKNPSNTSATFYKNFIKRIKASRRKGGKIRALFWLQGESDASNAVTAHSYKANLKKFFTDIRNDIKQRLLPIIIIKIVVYDPFMEHATHDLEAVRAAEDEVQRELPKVQIIDPLPLVNLTTREGFNKDHAHYNINTEIKLGKLMADTYLSYYGNVL